MVSSVLGSVLLNSVAKFCEAKRGKREFIFSSTAAELNFRIEGDGRALGIVHCEKIREKKEAIKAKRSMFLSNMRLRAEKKDVPGIMCVYPRFFPFLPVFFFRKEKKRTKGCFFCGLVPVP